MAGPVSVVREDLADWIVEINGELNEMESIPENDGKMESVTRNEPQPPKGRKSTIHRIPDSLHGKAPPRYWEPRHLKLGPFHPNNAPWKRCVFLHSLKRSNRPLNAYVEALQEVVQDLKDAYDEPDRVLFQTDRGFFILMIVDGCVLVEILHELAKFRLQAHNSDHPLWGGDGSSHSDLAENYKHDMMLLENQLPMQLLKRLIAVQTDCKPEEAVVQVFECIDLIFDSPVGLNRIQNPRACSHVLDLYRRSLFGEIQRRRRRQLLTQPFNFNIPSATDLNDAGIRFQMSGIGISAGRGNLRLPQMLFDGESKGRFINIIAYEQLQEDAKEVTSYIYFMSCLLRDANDVRILRSNGIIRTGLINDEIAEMFRSLTRDIIMRDPHTFFSPMFRRMSQILIETFDRKNKAWKKDLWQKYLKSPWAIVSLVVAFVLFALTVVQTVYTTLGYYKSK